MNRSKDDLHQSRTIAVMCFIFTFARPLFVAMEWSYTRWLKWKKERSNARMKHIILYATSEEYRAGQHRFSEVTKDVILLAITAAIGVALMWLIWTITP